MDRKELLQSRKLQHKKSTKSIKEFLNTFLDDQSFIETDNFLFSEAADLSGESVLSGQATIGGKIVFVVAQNTEVLQGGVGKAHAEKFSKALKLAFKMRMPVISVLDSCGAYIEEGVQVLDAYADILSNANRLSGEVPHFCVVKGNALGNMSFFTSLCDVVYMFEKSIVAVNSPNVLAAVENNTADISKLFGSKIHEEFTGLCTFKVTEKDFPSHLARVLKYLPVNSHTGTEIDDVSEEELNKPVPMVEKETNVVKQIEQIFDNNSFIEFHKEFAKNIIVGLAKMAGITVGVVANNHAIDCGRLCSNSARKATKFISFCDSFNIPVVTIVNCEGVVESISREHSTLVSDIGRLFSTYNNATVPKISLITENAIGTGFTAFASKALGIDFVLSWMNASIAPVGKSIGGLIAYNDFIESSDDPVLARSIAEQKYADVDSDPFNCAVNGLVDNVIAPKSSRKYLISALQIFNFKHNDIPSKKHNVSIL